MQTYELQRVQADLEAQRESLETERHQLEQAKAELEAQRQALEAQRRQWEQSPSDSIDADVRDEADVREEMETLTFEQPSQEAPADALEILRRLGQGDISADEERPAEPVHARHAPTAPVEIGRPGALASPSEHGEHGEEPSIEDYMVKLMERVRGRSDTEASKVLRPAPRPVAPKPVAKPAPAPAPAPAPKPASPVEPFSMSPRPLPPELSSNLSAMRELANFSARSAIDQSLKDRWVQAAFGKLSVAILGMAAGALLLYWAPDYVGITFLGAVTALVVAIFWSLQSVIIFHNVAKAARQNANQTTAEYNASSKPKTPVT